MKQKKVIFLSHVMNKRTPLYAGRKGIVLKQAKAIKKGAPYNIMHWSFPNHTGTHIDAPFHFIAGGKSITDFNAGFWIFNKVGLVKISDVTAGHVIKAGDLGSIKDCELLLIKTGFEKFRSKKLYWLDSPALHPELSLWLKKRCPSLRAVGVDFISITNLNNRELGRAAHKAFLNNHVSLIEDMKLSGVASAPDLAVAAPLLVEKADGSPCTVFGMYR